MGFLVGRRYRIGGKDTGHPRRSVAELTISRIVSKATVNRIGFKSDQYLIRDDGGAFAVVPHDKPWAEAIVVGCDVLDAASKIHAFLLESV